MCTTIQTQNGYIHYWYDDAFKKQSNQSVSKSERERKIVAKKLNQLYPKAHIEHEESGAPILKNADFSFVSVSHYQGWFALFVSAVVCGIDIQPFKDNMLKGKHYFINKKEEELNLTLQNLHLIWAAKETFYKKKKGKIKDLKNEVSVVEIDAKNQALFLIYKGKKEQLNLQIEQELVVVWT